LKNSGFLKPKKLTDAQRQLREAYKLGKVKLRSRTGAIGSFYEDQWVPSQSQLGCYKLLKQMERQGKIQDLKHQEQIAFSVFREDGLRKVIQINIDFVFFHRGINRPCRWDWKPPRVVHTKNGRRYPQKIHEGWFERFELLKFCEPDFDYRILTKESYDWIDL